MTDDNDFEEDMVPDPAGQVGARLRAAREERNLSLKDIAHETRIPLRHLETLEKSDFAALPGKTYAIGFAKSYARTVELDEVAIGEDVRREFDELDTGTRTEYQAFQPADPSRVPSRFLAWTAGLVALLLFGAWAIWRLDYFNDNSVDPYAETSRDDAAPGFAGDEPAAPPADPANVAADAPVVLTATDRVWFRIDDAGGNRIHEQELAAGERYTVPREPKGLMFRTARTQALTITVGGQPIASLGPPDTLVSNVPLAPQALVARAENGS